MLESENTLISVLTKEEETKELKNKKKKENSHSGESAKFSCFFIITACYFSHFSTDADSLHPCVLFGAQEHDYTFSNDY